MTYADVNDTPPYSDGFAADRARAFAAAARHSRRVHFLRLALPASGLAIAVLVVGISIVSKIEIAFSIGDLKITAEGLSMDAPHLSGSDGKGRIYDVNATRAVQSLSDPQKIKLYGITAFVQQPDGRSANFSAASGLYDARAQKLALQEDIEIRSNDGSSADLQHAEIDLSTGEVVSDAPVAFSSSLGAVEADGMTVGEKGGTVTFQGGVKMTVDPNAMKNTGTGKDAARSADTGNTSP